MDRVKILKNVKTMKELGVNFPYIYHDLLNGKKYMDDLDKLKAKTNATRVNKYYTNHLEEVKKENLITQIDNPEQIKELRKWIWTVLKKIKK